MKPLSAEPTRLQRSSEPPQAMAMTAMTRPKLFVERMVPPRNNGNARPRLSQSPYPCISPQSTSFEADLFGNERQSAISVWPPARILRMNRSEAPLGCCDRSSPQEDQGNGCDGRGCDHRDPGH